MANMSGFHFVPIEGSYFDRHGDPGFLHYLESRGIQMYRYKVIASRTDREYLYNNHGSGPSFPYQTRRLLTQISQMSISQGTHSRNTDGTTRRRDSSVKGFKYNGIFSGNWTGKNANVKKMCRQRRQDWRPARHSENLLRRQSSP